MPLRKFIEGDGDDRQDDSTRGRLREIQAGLMAWADSLESRWRGVVIAEIVIALVVSALAGFAWHNSRNVNKALCTFRNDLQNTQANARQYLMDHPQGAPGIPAATIKTTIANRERTIRSLAALNCPEVTK